MDNQKIGESTVAPYTLRWNIVMTDTPVSWWEPPVMVTRTAVITQPDGSLAIAGEEVITLTHVISVTRPITDPVELANLAPDQLPETFIGFQKVYSGGFSVISTTLGYTETHLIHIIAHDSAGNETKTEPIQVLGIHKEEEEEEEEEETAAAEGEAFLHDELPLIGIQLPAALIESEPVLRMPPGVWRPYPNAPPSLSG